MPVIIPRTRSLIRPLLLHFFCAHCKVTCNLNSKFNFHLWFNGLYFALWSLCLTGIKYHKSVISLSFTLTYFQDHSDVKKAKIEVNEKHCRALSFILVSVILTHFSLWQENLISYTSSVILTYIQGHSNVGKVTHSYWFMWCCPTFQCYKRIWTK